MDHGKGASHAYTLHERTLELAFVVNGKSGVDRSRVNVQGIASLERELPELTLSIQHGVLGGKRHAAAFAFLNRQACVQLGRIQSQGATGLEDLVLLGERLQLQQEVWGQMTIEQQIRVGVSKHLGHSVVDARQKPHLVSKVFANVHHKRFFAVYTLQQFACDGTRGCVVKNNGGQPFDVQLLDHLLNVCRIVVANDETGDGVLNLGKRLAELLHHGGLALGTPRMNCSTNACFKR